MQEVKDFITVTAETRENIVKNILDAKQRTVKNITELAEFRERTPIAIVGGGPSLETQLDHLREYKYIMACGSVHDYLIKNFIVPKWCVVVDPSPIVIDYMQMPTSTIDYLIASQCHPSVFDYLANNKISLWHAGGAESDNLAFGEGQTLIAGGCTVGTRAIMMALAFGYSNINLFGFDTCLTNDYKHHAYSFMNPDKETLGNITEVALGGPDGKRFKVANYMLGQLMDFKSILGGPGKYCKFTVHGGGLLAELLELGKRGSSNG